MHNLFLFWKNNKGDIVQKSIWEDIVLPVFPTLDKDIETEVLVIGAGISGLLIADRLRKEGKKVIVVEKNRVGGERTKFTTATITALEDIRYGDLINKYGMEFAKTYLKANIGAIQKYRDLSETLDFDFESVSSYKYAKTEWEREELLKEYQAILSLDYPVKWIDHWEYDMDITGAIELENQGQMNPLRLIQNLVSGLTIYEQTKIEKIQNHVAYTKEHIIQAKYIIVSTGYPFVRRKGLYFTKLIQNKSYVAVIKDDTLPKGNAVGWNAEDIYFRTYKEYYIFGGNDHRVGQERKGYIPILSYILKKYPNKEVEYHWVNEDTISSDGIAYIGKFCNSMPDVFVATGFNLWGMTKAMIASEIICDTILQKENEYEWIFNPKRKPSLSFFIKNMGIAIRELLLPTTKRCGHLGCGLHYNKQEHTYECLCHGSKYDEKGNLIFNPAIHNKKKD